MKSAFILFISIFLLVYSGMHLYVFLKARNAFGLSLKGGAPVLLFLACMMCASFVVRLLDNSGSYNAAKIMAHIGYTWMAVIFLFCCIAFAGDVYNLIICLTRFVTKIKADSFLFTGKMLFVVPSALSILIAIYGYYEAKDIKIEKVVIKSKKIPENIKGINIVQISDVHLGIMMNRDRLIKIVRLVESFKPDILVSTGDLVDAVSDNLNGYADLLKGIEAKYGKYAVTGNHEFYAGIEKAKDFTKRAGFKLLEGEMAAPVGFVSIIGVGDSVGRSFGGEDRVSEEKLLRDAPRMSFNLLLKHRPDIDKDSIGLFDLQLSGHMHKGQIFPFNLVIRLFYRRYVGLWNIGEGSFLYISRGTGTWGPSIRFLAPPEVTVFRIERE